MKFKGFINLFLCAVFALPCGLQAGQVNGTMSGAQAGNPNSSCSPPSPPSPGGPPCLGSDDSVADPIHPLTGNSFQSINVFTGGGEFPLQFNWYYNSRMRPTESQPHFHALWTYNYGQNLSVEPDRITYERTDGRRIVFDVIGENFPLTLRNSSAAMYGALTKQGDHYYYQGRSKLIHEFDATGQLVKVSNGNGLTHTVTTALEGLGRRVTVSHSNGRSLQLIYADQTTRLPSKLIDSESNEYVFSVNQIDGIELLNSVAFPDYQASNDSVIQLQYLNSYSNPSPNWLYRTALEAIFDEEGWQKAFWWYSPEGYAIGNFLGSNDDATEVYDVTPVEAASGSQHYAYVKNPYGCTLAYLYHAPRKGQGYSVLPWLNYILGSDTSVGCEMVGMQIHYSKTPGVKSWRSGGLLDSGYPNVFTDNVYEKQSEWNADIRKNSVERRAYLNEDGVTDTVFSRTVYTYHSSYRTATKIERYQDDSAESLWQEVQYTYYDGVSDVVNNGRIKKKVVIDHKSTTNGNPLQIRERTWQYLYEYYDSAHTVVRRKEVVNPRGYSTVILFTPEGYIESSSRLSNPSNSSNTLSLVTSFQDFTVHGNAQTIIDVNNGLTSRVYSARGWLLSETIEGKAKHYDYYLNGLLKRTTNPAGDWIEYEYTTARKLKKILYSNGDSVIHTESMDRESAHQKTKTQQWFTAAQAPPVRSLTSTYDALDRVISTSASEGLSKQFFYEDPRFKLKVTRLVVKGDTNYPDRTTLYSYTPVGQLETIRNGDLPTVPEVSYIYDNNGNLTSVLDSAGNTTSYKFDGFNQMLSSLSPDTESTFYEYDASGNMVIKYDSDLRISEYGYDHLDRVKTVTYPLGLEENVSYSYDSKLYGNVGVGRVTGIEDRSGGTQLFYNSLGRLERKEVFIESTKYIWKYQYNDNGQLSTLTYPSGRIVEYVRDPITQEVISVITQDWAGAPQRAVIENIKRLPQGLDTFNYGNAVSVNYDYNTDARLTGIHILGENSVLDWGYIYNSLNSITDILDADQASQSRSFIYDSQDRLKQADGSFGQLMYTYNAVHNRLTKTESPLGGPSTDSILSYIDPATGSDQSNRLWSVSNGGTSRQFDYDAAGNIITDSLRNTHYDYNLSNRLTGVINDLGQTTYTHNSIGQRTTKFSPNLSSGGRHYHYGDEANLLGEYARDGRVAKEYIYLGATLIAVLEPDPSADTDIDGMDDDWELLHFNSLNHDGAADTDLDSMSDLLEFISGGNPNVIDQEIAGFVDSDSDSLPDDWELT